MAWYRCGGGGIPSSLKTNMDAVLNKKFGTSTTYAPATWPDNVNLLGPLPEKTASGSVASITDGADGVPVKNWGVKVDANLSGVSSVVCTQTGLQLVPITVPSNGAGITYTDAGGGKITVSGRATSNVTNKYMVTASDMNLLKRDETYYVSGCPAGGASNTYKLQVWNSSTSSQVAVDYGSGASFTMPTEGNINVRFVIYSGQEVSFTVAPMITKTATTEQAAYNPTVTTVSLGRTIHGGEADVVNGTGKSTHGMVTLTSDMINNAIAYTYQNKNGVQISSVFPVNVIRQTDNICSHAEVKQGASSDASYMWFGSTAGNKEVYWVGILDDMGLTLEQWKTWALTQTIVCVYTLPTPTDFTFTPISPTPETALGVNNFWADAGDSEVTYRADINMLIASLSGNRGLMMTRPQLEAITEETKEDPEVTER